MADLHILRVLNLGFPEARRVGFKGAEQVEEEFDMICTYEEGATQDEVCFTRSGIHGTLHVTKDKFDLKAKLGFLVGAFKGKIEREIVKNLDELLESKAHHKPKPHAKPHAVKKK